MNAQAKTAEVIARVKTRAARKQPTEQQRALADMLEQRGYAFVSLDPADPVEIIVARGPDTGGLATGFVFQPLLHQFPELLAYGFCQLGLDGLIIVAPDSSLEQLTPLLRDQPPAAWRGKVGVVTSSALDLLFSLHPPTRQSPAQDANKPRQP